MKIFESYFQNIKSEVKIVSIMKKMILTKLNNYMPDFKNVPCQQHVDYIINLLLTVQIFKECKWPKNRYKTRLKRFQNYEFRKNVYIVSILLILINQVKQVDVCTMMCM